MATLATVPQDVLELIAYHAATASTTKPPSGLRSLLLLNRRTHSLLQTSSLPHLYASIFRATFDLPALHRRFPRSRLTAPRLALELKRRWTALKILRGNPTREADDHDSPLPPSPEAIIDHDQLLWVVFLLCLENDGNNLFLLRNYAKSLKWISNLAGRTFAHSATPGAFLPPSLSLASGRLPKDTIEVALTVWLFWYLKGSKGDLKDESVLEKERNRTMLRIFVFAAQIFDAHLQSWTIATLPLTPPSPSVEEGPTTTSPRSPELDQSFYADLDPRSRTCTIEYFGGDLAVGKPNACWAGMMSFFLRTGVWREAADLEDEGEEVEDMHAAEGEMEGGTLPAVIGRANGTSLRREAGSTVGLRTSALFDLEWSRLVDCREPYLALELDGVQSGSEGLGIWKVRGSFEGVWGGEFAFLDFDSYRDMLSGRDRVIYEGAYGIQPQIFRLTEHLVLRPEGLAPPSSSEATPSLNSFFPADFAFPFTQTSPSGADLTGVIGYTLVDALKEARLKESGTADVVKRLEIIVSGTGHSAWGKFNLSGRVRVWDGLVYLMKDYSPESRGRWLYRGYVVAGEMVGRWRDTFSPEQYSGYEGSFHMTRRE